MFGTQYVAANCPAWASPRSLGSQFGCRPVVQVGPHPVMPFSPEELMATCSEVFDACACRQVYCQFSVLSGWFFAKGLDFSP